jgi:hypothetical protein
METNLTQTTTNANCLGNVKEKNYIAVPGAKGVVALAMDNKIRDVQHLPKFQEKIDEVIKNIWEIYCGADPAMLTDEFVKEASDNIVRKFSMLGVNEIKEAFRLASNNVISSDLRSFGGRISIQVIGKTLDSYLEYRKPIAAEILAEQREEQRIKDEAADMKSRNDYQKAVIEFWYEGNPESWLDCPSYFLETLVEMEVVTLVQEKQFDFYRMAKRYREKSIEAMKHKAISIDEIRKALQQFIDSEGERIIITNYAKSMYLFELQTSSVKSK